MDIESSTSEGEKRDGGEHGVSPCDVFWDMELFKAEGFSDRFKGSLMGVCSDEDEVFGLLLSDVFFEEGLEKAKSDECFESGAGF